MASCGIHCLNTNKLLCICYGSQRSLTRFAYAMVVKSLLLSIEHLNMMEKMCILESLSYRLDGFVNCS